MLWSDTSEQAEHHMSQQQYLYSMGWQRHEQSWAQTYMNQFNAKQNQWQHKKCTTWQ